MKFAASTLLVLAAFAYECPSATIQAPGEQLKNPFSPACWFEKFKCWRTRVLYQDAVWSPDGKLILGSQYVDEVQKSLDPLNGSGVNQRKTCHQLFVSNPDGSNRRNIGGYAPYQNTQNLFFYPELDYALVQVLEPNPDRSSVWQYDIVNISTGKSARLATGPFNFGGVIPSPDGRILGYYDSIQNEQDINATTIIEFFTYQGQSTGVKATFSGAGVPWVTWNPAGQFVFTDNDKSLAFYPNGTQLEVPTPRCQVPQTTSSSRNAKGEHLAATDSGFIIDDIWGAWGCQ
jgi:hypothetical protein